MNRSVIKYTFATAADLAPAGSVTLQVDIPKKYSRFVCTAISQLTLGAALTGITKANEQLPLILANIKPRLEDAGLCNVATPLHSLAGNAGEPLLLDEPIAFEGNTSPVLTLDNISTDTTYKAVYVTLHGYHEE